MVKTSRNPSVKAFEGYVPLIFQMSNVLIASRHSGCEDNQVKPRPSSATDSCPLPLFYFGYNPHCQAIEFKLDKVEGPESERNKKSPKQ